MLPRLWVRKSMGGLYAPGTSVLFEHVGHSVFPDTISRLFATSDLGPAGHDNNPESWCVRPRQCVASGVRNG